MTHKKYVPALAAGVVFFLLIIIIAVRLGKGTTSETPEDAAAIAQGVAYLQSLESQDPDTVDNVLKQQRLQRLRKCGMSGFVSWNPAKFPSGVCLTTMCCWAILALWVSLSMAFCRKNG